MAQPRPQILEYLIRDMNPKRFNYNNSPLGSMKWRSDSLRK